MKRHYHMVAERPAGHARRLAPRNMNHTVVVLVGGVHRGVLEALAYAIVHCQPSHLMAVSVVSDEEEQERLEEALGRSTTSKYRSTSSDSPYRELTRPILRYIDEIEARWENDIDHGAAPGVRRQRHWWGNILHNQTALFLKGPVALPEGDGRDIVAVHYLE